MNRRAITPVIAVVLLLMMTVAAAGAAYFWMTTIQSRIQGQIGTQVSESTLTGSRFIQIISVICNNGSPSTINVTLQNTGTTSIDAGTTAITLSDDQGATLGTSTTTMTSLAPNGIATISYSLTQLLTPGDTFGIKVTLPEGSEQTADCVST